jgi:hypothetical protein
MRMSKAGACFLVLLARGADSAAAGGGCWAASVASWTTLAPNNKIFGGRQLSSRTPTSANRAAAILRRCAMSLGRTSTALGAFYRRLAVRIGKAKAITATARKLALLVYRALCGKLAYHDPAPPLTYSIARASSSPCVNAPTCSASTWSIALPVRYYSILFLRRSHGRSSRRVGERSRTLACLCNVGKIIRFADSTLLALIDFPNI